MFFGYYYYWNYYLMSFSKLVPSLVFCNASQEITYVNNRSFITLISWSQLLENCLSLFLLSIIKWNLTFFLQVLFFFRYRKIKTYCSIFKLVTFDRLCNWSNLRTISNFISVPPWFYVCIIKFLLTLNENFFVAWIAILYWLSFYLVSF